MGEKGFSKQVVGGWGQGSRVRVLVVDDSPAVRAHLSQVLSVDSDIQVVGTAGNGKEAVARVLELSPDLVTLDVEMPLMDGLEAVREIMSIRATPILVITSPDIAARRNVAFEAVRAGALDVFMKPRGEGTPDFESQADRLRKQVRLLAGVQVVSRRRRREAPATEPVPEAALSERSKRPVEVVAIGASTGGPKALAELLHELPSPFPAAVVVVQHMAAEFVDGFGEWLSTNTALPVKLAQSDDPLRPGVVHLAPGDRHLKLSSSGRCVLDDGPERHSCRPSVDELFLSVAHVFGEAVVAALLTGMGRDGAEGLLSLREAGANTIAQDEHTSTVFGMPGAAIEIGAATAVLPLPEIGPTIVDLTLESLSTTCQAD